jgi:hypothetical protein
MLACCAQTTEGTGVRRRVFPVLAFELLDKIVEETVVKVLATQVSVADGGFDLKDTVLNSQEEHVEDSSEIKDKYIALAGDILVEAMASAVGSIKYAGTVITPLLQVVPRYDSAVSFSSPRRPYTRFPQVTR